MRFNSWPLFSKAPQFDIPVGEKEGELLQHPATCLRRISTCLWVTAELLQNSRQSTTLPSSGNDGVQG